MTKNFENMFDRNGGKSRSSPFPWIQHNLGFGPSLWREKWGALCAKGLRCGEGCPLSPGERSVTASPQKHLDFAAWKWSVLARFVLTHFSAVLTEAVKLEACPRECICFTSGFYFHVSCTSLYAPKSPSAGPLKRFPSTSCTTFFSDHCLP